MREEEKQEGKCWQQTKLCIDFDEVSTQAQNRSLPTFSPSKNIDNDWTSIVTGYPHDYSVLSGGVIY